jgi:hypothetical protein
VDGSPAKRKLTIFLGLVPLTANERRTRKRLIHLVASGDSLVLFASFYVGFTRNWWAASGVLVVLNIALVAWYFVAIRRAVERGDLPRWKAPVR